VEQLAGYSVMIEVNILMISGLLGYTVQRDILEPCHGDSDKLSLGDMVVTTEQKHQLQNCNNTFILTSLGMLTSTVFASPPPD